MITFGNFITLGHEFGNLLVAIFDELNGVPSEKEVTLEKVLDNDKSHRMKLFNEQSDEKDTEFVDDVVIEFHEIRVKQLDFSMENPMTFSDSYTFSIETSHWRLIVQPSRHKQPQWFLKYCQVIEYSTVPMFELPRVVSNMFDLPHVVQYLYIQESNVFIGLWMLMKLFFTLFHSQKCGLLWVAREILSQELLSGQLCYLKKVRGLFRQILSSDLLSGQLCYIKKVRGLFRQILSSDLLSGQLC